MNNSAMVKPALANTKIPKYIKKSLKFAKGVDGGESPGRNSAADQWRGDYAPYCFPTWMCYLSNSDLYHLILTISWSLSSQHLLD